MRDHKVGDWVIFTDKKISATWEKSHKSSLYNKIAKIIYIIMDSSYLLEFKKNINNYRGNRKGRDGHCKWCGGMQFKYAIDHLKFKKWVKG